MAVPLGRGTADFPEILGRVAEAYREQPATVAKKSVWSRSSPTRLSVVGRRVPKRSVAAVERPAGVSRTAVATR